MNTIRISHTMEVLGVNHRSHFFFKQKTYFHWRTALQYCVGFYHTSALISIRYTSVTSLLSLPPTSGGNPIFLSKSSFTCHWLQDPIIQGTHHSQTSASPAAAHPFCAPVHCQEVIRPCAPRHTSILLPTDTSFLSELNLLPHPAP